jgi:hypothetical protein
MRFKMHGEIRLLQKKMVGLDGAAVVAVPVRHDG